MGKSTVQVNSRPQRVVAQGDPDTLLLNLDPGVTIYLTDSRGDLASNLGGNIPLQPLGTVVINGDDGDTWAVTSVGQVANLASAPNTKTLTVSPASIAQQIALSGLSSAAPQFLSTLGTFATGAAWGPFTIPLTNGGGYMLAVLASGVNGGTDITIDHLDINNNIVYEEFFGAVTSETTQPGPTIIRGNVQGVSLRIKGQVCPTTFFTAISGSAFAASSVTVTAYSLPFALANDTPKMMAAGFLSTLTGGLLLSVDSLAVAFGATVQSPSNIVPYAGPVSISYRCAGVTTAANARLNLSFWTAAQFIASATALGTARFMSTGAQVETQISYNLPCCYVNAQFANTDGANNGTMFAHITAGAYP
jgi:hypothetical protein